jgi:hypothetical protein
MVARLVVAISFLLVMFTVVDAFAFSSGSRRNNSAASSDTSSTNVVKAVEPTSVYALASGVLLLGGAAWLIRRK